MGTFDATSASCYIPAYPGSQIWFEYSIDGPHPPKSAYFFKLFINGAHITSWDCTAEHDYHGKTNYCLQHVRNASGAANASQRTLSTAVERRAFQFTITDEDQEKMIALNNDFIELRIHRIEHRQRVRKLFDLPSEQLTEQGAGKLRLINSGTLEPGRPQRRYKYQLLDPADAPYAKFRFFCRSYEWLESHGLLNNPIVPVDESVDSSVLWCDPNQIEMIESSPSGYGTPDYNHPWITSNNRSPLGSPARKPTLSPLRSTQSFLPIFGPELKRSSASDRLENMNRNHQQGSLTDSDESFSLVTKGSIEDLTPNVPRSPRSSRRKHSQLRDGTTILDQASPPGTKSQQHRNAICDSSQKHHKSTQEKNAAGDVGGSGAVAAEKSSRPLSPFTNGGFLRRLRTPTPTNMHRTSEDGHGKTKERRSGEGDRDEPVREDASAARQAQSSNILGNLRRMFVS